MATLTRWKRYVPSWLDNASSPEPFALEVRRATWGERRAFVAALQTADGLPESERAAHLVAAFLPLVRGPIGDLVVDGERIGTTDALLRVALDEPNVAGNLFTELVDAVLGESTLPKAPSSPSA